MVATSGPAAAIAILPPRQYLYPCVIAGVLYIDLHCCSGQADERWRECVTAATSPAPGRCANCGYLTVTLSSTVSEPTGIGVGVVIVLPGLTRCVVGAGTSDCAFSTRSARQVQIAPRWQRDWKQSAETTDEKSDRTIERWSTDTG
jgi:hypothetical protein